MTPYLASLGWCGERLRGNSPVPPRRRWNRTIIAPDEMLSIPVQGGINAVKHGDPLLWQADDTRAWRHQHAGAINARLGRTPFYHYYVHKVLDIITDTSITSVAEIAEAIYTVMSEALGAESFISELRQADTEVRQKIKAYSESLGAKEADKDIALLNYLCRYGPDTIFIMAYPLL